MGLTVYGGFLSNLPSNISPTHGRMDKYYLLIRRFVNAAFRLLMRSDWESGLCQVYNNILTTKGGPLW